MNARGESAAEAGGARTPAAQLPTADSFFRSVVEAASEGVWILDRDGKTIFANERMAEMLGGTASEMIGRSPFDFLPEEEWPRAQDSIVRTLGGEAVEFEIRFRRVDGRTIAVLGGSSPLRDEAGDISGAVGMFSDLTARIESEQALRISERDASHAATLFLQLLESSSDAIWLRDPEGRFLIVNPPAARIIGGSPEEIVGRKLEEVWGAEFGRALIEQSEALFKSGKALTVEEEVADHARGRTAFFLSNKVPLFNADGSRLGILGVSRDITDLKRTEEELRTSKDRLARQVAELNALYGSAPIGLAFYDREYRFIRINQELADINGVPPEAHIGRTIAEVLPNAPSVTPYIDQVFLTGEPTGNIEVTGQTPLKPGQDRTFLTGYYPVTSESGEVEAVGIWVIEISERKAAEQREQLLAREVDHRAKNLLAVVQSIVQLSRATSVEEFKEGISGRIQSLARAHSLLADSRWEGVELTQLVTEELAPFSGPGGARVAHSGPLLLMRPAAAQSLALVLHELATNAAKHGALSNPDGAVSLAWSTVDSDSGPALRLDWIERGGPPPTAPGRSGFGSRLILTSVERQLRGKLVRDWLPEGLHCTLTVPASVAIAAKPSEGSS